MTVVLKTLHYAALLMLIVFAVYAVQNGSGHTALDMISLLAVPGSGLVVLALLCAFKRCRSRTAAATAFTFAALFVFILLTFKLHFLLNYDTWIREGMPEKPAAANPIMLILLLCFAVASLLLRRVPCSARDRCPAARTPAGSGGDDPAED